MVKEVGTHFSKGCLGFLLSLVIIGVGQTSAWAANYVVTSLADNTANDGSCTLREAILAANNTPANDDCGPASPENDLITFGINGTITLGGPLSDIEGTLEIDGEGQITLRGNNTFRFLIVRSEAVLILCNLTLQNGSIDFGGAIYNSGTLTITNSTFSSNSATYHGGAIYNEGGTGTITNSNFSTNSAPIGAVPSPTTMVL